MSGNVGRFAREMRIAVARIERRERDIFLGVVTEAQRSIVEGSEITGSPGQPVDIGTLKGSWQLQMESPRIALISTGIDYAPPIEDGVGAFGPMQLRSEVGGWHSRALTIAGMDRIVDHVTRTVGR